MRIRKQQPRGNAGGESSGANPGLGSQEQELIQSSRGVKDKPGDEVQMVNSGEEVIDEGLNQASGARQVRVGIERVDSACRSQYTWLDKLRHSKGLTELEPYSDLEEYVKSLSKKDGASPSRGVIQNSEEVVEGSDPRRLVGGTDSNLQHLARYGSVCSELSSKQASFGGLEGAFSPVLFSCDDSSNVPTCLPSDPTLQNTIGNQQYAANKSKDSRNIFPEKPFDASGPSQYDGCKETEDLALSLGRKDKYEGEVRRPHKWKRDRFEERVESSDKRQRAGTSSEKPLHYEIKSGTMEGPCTDISLRPATVEAGPFEQGRVSSTPVLVETGFGVLKNDQPQASVETLQRRSGRNRRIPSFTGVVTGHGSHVAAKADSPILLSPDHPAQQPKESLAFSLYTVCERAGKAGLTAREAMSDIMQQGLPGLENSAVRSSRRIAKQLRNSPYYMEIGAGKFALCSAVIDIKQKLTGEGSSPTLQRDGSLQNTKQCESSTADDSKTSTDDEDKTPVLRQKRKRNRVASTREAASELETEVKSRPVRSGRPKKLKYMKQENAEKLGNQCNRTDGKGWICPLLAKPGYQLCDHHLDKLRCKPGSRSKKKKNLAAALADEAEATHTREEPHLVDTAGHEFTSPVGRRTGPSGTGSPEDYPD